MHPLIIYFAGLFTLPVLIFLVIGFFEWKDGRETDRAAKKDIAESKARMAARGHLPL